MGKGVAIAESKSGAVSTLVPFFSCGCHFFKPRRLVTKKIQGFVVDEDMVVNIPNLLGIFVSSIVKDQREEENVSSYESLVKQLSQRHKILPNISISSSHPVISSFRPVALS